MQCSRECNGGRHPFDQCWCFGPHSVPSASPTASLREILRGSWGPYSFAFQPPPGVAFHQIVLTMNTSLELPSPKVPQVFHLVSGFRFHSGLLHGCCNIVLPSFPPQRVQVFSLGYLDFFLSIWTVKLYFWVPEKFFRDGCHIKWLLIEILQDVLFLAIKSI